MREGKGGQGGMREGKGGSRSQESTSTGGQKRILGPREIQERSRPGAKRVRGQETKQPKRLRLYRDQRSWGKGSDTQVLERLGERKSGGTLGERSSDSEHCQTLGKGISWDLTPTSVSIAAGIKHVLRQAQVNIQVCFKPLSFSFLSSYQYVFWSLDPALLWP